MIPPPVFLTRMVISLQIPFQFVKPSIVTM